MYWSIKIDFPPFLPGHFLFLPSSDRTPANENAQLLSPHLPPTKGTCLKFWAYKPDSCVDQCSSRYHSQVAASTCESHCQMCLMCFLNVCSGQRAEGVEAVWRSSPSAAGGEWTGSTVETLWHQHHIYWGIPGQTLTVYTNFNCNTMSVCKPSLQTKETSNSAHSSMSYFGLYWWKWGNVSNALRQISYNMYIQVSINRLTSVSADVLFLFSTGCVWRNQRHIGCCRSWWHWVHCRSQLR